EKPLSRPLGNCMMGFATTARMQTERFEGLTPKESVSEPGMQEVVTQSSIMPPTKLELFEEIILPHLNSAYNLARWLTRNEHDAEDVVQEAFLRALRSFDTFTVGRDARAWLLTIVRNSCRTWHRQNRSREMNMEWDLDSEPAVASWSDPEAVLIKNTNSQLIHEAMD